MSRYTNIKLNISEGQKDKIKRALEAGCDGVSIRLSHDDLATAGKFLLSSVLPGLATGALSGLGSAATTKIIDKISGSGGVIYIRKGDRTAKIVRQGEGLFLKPWFGSGLNGQGDGLYMKTGKGLFMKTGKGLILGPNSPFSNIPILGWLL